MSKGVKVRCTNEACGWTGTRGGHYVMSAGRSIWVGPTHKGCPQCGARVEEVDR